MIAARVLDNVFLVLPRLSIHTKAPSLLKTRTWTCAHCPRVYCDATADLPLDVLSWNSILQVEVRTTDDRIMTEGANVRGLDQSFENIINFRDVGKTVNEFLGKRLVAEGKLYRSARPDDATLNDRVTLREIYGITTIIDLRTKTEHANRLEKRRNDLKVPALIQSNAALAQPMEIPGITYKPVNINGKGFERSLLWKLSPWSFVKLVVLMLFGFRMKAIAVLGREVLLPRGLVGLGFDSLDHCGPEIAETLRVYANAPNYPILIHCTQGKDRTGLVIFIILLLLDVPTKAMTFDYRLSETELLPEKEGRLKEIKSIGLSEEFANCPEDWIERMKDHLDEKYGGVREYCRSINFSEQDEERLKSLLRA